MNEYLEIPFPLEKDKLYVIGIYHENEFQPFYVGISSRNIGRIGDYISAKFTAATDFKVGEAVKYLSIKNYKVFIRYRSLKMKSIDESNLIHQYRQKYKLLNDLGSYNYKVADENEERKKIHDFVDELISDLEGPNTPHL